MVSSISVHGFHETGLSRGLQVIRETCQTLPQGPGVYRMVSSAGEVLYVGKAKNLCRRVTSYTQVPKLPLRLQRMVAETNHLEIVTTHTEAEALLLEANLIQKLHPKYNIVFKDNKSMAYILLTQETWPALRKHRGPRLQKGSYFGPFPSVRDITTTLTSLMRAFLIRSCSDTFFQSCVKRKRPCLQYHIKRCSAPCVQKITPEAYACLVQEAHQTLTGQSHQVQKQLAQEMGRFSQQQLYEQAASLRDRIQALTQLQSQQSIFSTKIRHADIMGVAQQSGLTCFQMFFFREGGNYGTKAFFFSSKMSQEHPLEELILAFLSQFYQDVLPPPLVLLSYPLKEKNLLENALSQLAAAPVLIETPKSGPKAQLVLHAQTNAEEAIKRHLAQKESQKQLLHRLTEFMGLPTSPQRIEVYDNSHTQGKNAYGVMIVAGEEGFLKKAYRTFTFSSTLKAGDDYDMMREVFKRRFQGNDPHTSTYPDLILIDGGAGQLRVVHDVLTQIGLAHLPLLALSKGPNRNAGQETLHRLHLPPTHLSSDDPLLYYFQRLRDEAHRFAITTHRKKGLKAVHQSRLETIPGVGRERKRALLRHFGSLAHIKRAGLNDLCAVPSINRKLAEIIYAHFQNHG